VTFRSDASVIGKGFEILFTGKGSQVYPHKYKLVHLDDVVGSYHYERNEIGSDDGWGDADATPDENKILMIAYSTPTDAEGNSVIVFNVTVEDMVFGVDDNCKSDILHFYASPSREGFTLGESYPKTECQMMEAGGCGNCIDNKLSGNDSTPHTFSSPFRAFLGFYRPVASPVIGNQSFHLRWDSCKRFIMTMN
jgi:hypothetical protein